MSKLDAFFKSFADTEELLDVRMGHELIGIKVPVISTGSYVLDDALSCGGLPKGRLIQFYGPSGCHAKGQEIMLSTGSLKKIEDIVVGDKLMGENSEERTVLKLIRGVGKMYQIIPNKGTPFIVNEDHVLTLIRNNNSVTSPLRRNRESKSGFRRKKFSAVRHLQSGPKFELIDMTVKDYLSLSKDKKAYYKLIRSSVENFKNSNINFIIDPYVLGMLIGDGSLIKGINFVSSDQELLDIFEKFVINNNLRLHIGPPKKNRLRNYRGARIDTSKKNHIYEEISRLGLNKRCDWKFIPDEYKFSSFENRLQILAGLLDTDGHHSRGGFDFISKSEKLADDVVFISRSVGLAAYKNACIKSAHKNHSDTYYRVSISGDCTIIPTILDRKKANCRKINKNVLATGFSIKEMQVDNFYGFTLDGNGRYLLNDFTITHNSGKTLLSLIAIKNAQKDDPDAQQVFIDAEGTFDPGWAGSLDLDLSKIIIIDGDTAVNGRKCFEMLLGVPKEDAKTHVLKGKSKEGLLDKITNGEFNINLIVLDSLGAIIPPGEDVAAIGKMNMALMARFLTTTLRKLSLELNKAGVPMIMINHKRDSLDPYGADHTYAGGNSYTHFLSANIYFEAIHRKDSLILDEKEQKVGQAIRATIEKSKFGPWPRKCEFKVNFTTGIIDKHEEVALLALNYDVVKKPSNVSHEYADRKWVGFEKYCNAIKDDPELMEELIHKISEAREAKLDKSRVEQEEKKNLIVTQQEETAKKKAGRPKKDVENNE